MNRIKKDRYSSYNVLDRQIDSPLPYRQKISARLGKLEKWGKANKNDGKRRVSILLIRFILLIISLQTYHFCSLFYIESWGKKNKRLAFQP